MSHTGFSQRQELKQSQKLAPQMQQSLQILQAPALELRSLVQQALAENPVLEDETAEVSLEEQGLEEEDDGFDEEFSRLSQMDEEWREYMSQARKISPRTAADEEKRQFMLDSLVKPVTLQEHLLEQLHTEGVDHPVRGLAEFLIGHLDENGFLMHPVEELSLRNGIPLPNLEKARLLLQSFDPVGVCAENLSECLAVQLERLGKKGGLEYRLVTQHLEDLAKHRYPQIARKMGISAEQVAEAAGSIALLNPKPGRAFESGTNFYVSPDVYVEEDDNGVFTIRLNQEQIPQLRISNVYKDLMASQAGRGEVRDYIKDKIRNGRTLIHSIQQRQDTIRRIAEEIVTRQDEFLRNGRAYLKPMTMAQVASVVGVHETTVSRAIGGKYISTPQGVFEMRFFFRTGYHTSDGDELANTSVKDAIREIVSHEDPRRPLSDEGIRDALKERGIEIARRTVAKYREELDILPSHMRKTYSRASV